MELDKARYTPRATLSARVIGTKLIFVACPPTRFPSPAKQCLTTITYVRPKNNAGAKAQWAYT